MSMAPQKWYEVALLIGMPLSVYIWNMKDKERRERERASEAQKRNEVSNELQANTAEQDPFHVFEERNIKKAPAAKDDEHDRRVSEHSAYETRSMHTPPKIVKLASGVTLSLDD